uniref:Uncharacterized protein n=1 Tax=Anguilla anguilla TaxID=7936 RepID=A0A0E9TDG7_ANGAN
MKITAGQTLITQSTSSV